MNLILLVEDEPDMAATYERILRRAGHRVVTAASRAEGNATAPAQAWHRGAPEDL